MPTNLPLSRKIRIPFFIFFSLLYIFLVSLPILSAGYYADDIINGLTRAHLQLTHESLFHFSKNIFLQWFYGGRIFPFALFSTYYFCYLFHTLFAYQVARVMVIWLSLFSVAWFVKRVTQQVIPAVFILFLIPLFWSVRDACDPLTSFVILLPLVTIFSFLTLCCLLKALEKNKKYWLFLSVLMYSCAILTYEIGFVTLLAIVLLVMIYHSQWQQRIRIILPFMVISSVYLAACLALRKMAGAAVYDGVQLGNMHDFFHTFLDQFEAGLPLSYRLFYPVFKLFYLKNISTVGTLPQLIFASCLGAILSGISYCCLGKISLNKHSRFIFCLVGLIFSVFPAMMVAMSKKYQTIVHSGVGYLPVYFEYIGFTFLLLVLLDIFLKTIPSNWMRLLVSLGLGVVVGFSLFYNLTVVAHMNQHAKAHFLKDQKINNSRIIH